MSRGRREPTGVRGAVYLPARAANAYRMWAEYDPATIERDVGYASSLNLDALRITLSYERWRDDRRGFASAFDHLLGAAAARDLAVVPVLFEGRGVEPTPERLAECDPKSALPIRSPSATTIRDGVEGAVASVRRRLVGRERWVGPRAFTRWVAERYGDDRRVRALELMNEPGGWDARVEFAREMLRTAAAERPTAPLTVGCKRLADNRAYADPGLDVYQFRYDRPPTADHMAAALAAATELARADGVPIWLVGWQRTRSRPPAARGPDYASLAATIRESDVDGAFFGSLMLRAASALDRRRRGDFDGVFHEDGAVWCRDDARALAAEPVAAPERREPPRAHDADTGDTRGETNDNRY